MEATIKPKRKVDPNKYRGQVPGETDQEKIACAFLALAADRTFPVMPKQFLQVYFSLVEWMHDGLQIDFALHPTLEGTQLIRDIEKLQGTDLGVLLQWEALQVIASFLVDDKFVEELRSAFVEMEAKIIVSEFVFG